MQRGARSAFCESAPMQRGARGVFCESAPMQRGARFLLCDGRGLCYHPLCGNAPMQRGARLVFRGSVPMQRGARLAFCDSALMQRGARFVLGESAPMQRGARLAFCESAPMQRGARRVFCESAPVQRGTRFFVMRWARSVHHPETIRHQKAFKNKGLGHFWGLSGKTNLDLPGDLGGFGPGVMFSSPSLVGKGSAGLGKLRKASESLGRVGKAWGSFGRVGEGWEGFVLDCMLIFRCARERPTHAHSPSRPFTNLPSPALLPPPAPHPLTPIRVCGVLYI